jgi:hypothetical protein
MQCMQPCDGCTPHHPNHLDTQAASAGATPHTQDSKTARQPAAMSADQVCCSPCTRTLECMRGNNKLGCKGLMLCAEDNADTRGSTRLLLLLVQAGQQHQAAAAGAATTAPVGCADLGDPQCRQQLPQTRHAGQLSRPPGHHLEWLLCNITNLTVHINCSVAPCWASQQGTCSPPHPHPQQPTQHTCVCGRGGGGGGGVANKKKHKGGAPPPPCATHEGPTHPPTRPPHHAAAPLNPSMGRLQKGHSGAARALAHSW